MLRSLVGSEMCIRDRHQEGQLLRRERFPFQGAMVSVWSDRQGSPRRRPGDRLPDWHHWCHHDRRHQQPPSSRHSSPRVVPCHHCLLYTSDAADEEDSVDLGGRRIIKKKKKKEER
eukprot:TRINITY_DN42048_c0_g1_i1.p1 TRINITY_DN42048_c0_g1~~TRINITY_DN42048_c0_g1_i1.p1  ORF type:complete len:116 (+),score=21.59 TRINITY_DN42048_c0_g1_i1:147-494(+)